jgi:hypothetical protein
MSGILARRFLPATLLFLAGLNFLSGVAGAEHSKGVDFRPATPFEDSGRAPQSVSFINDVAPILKENCFACHDARKRKGKLDMTTYENFRKGGAHEDPVVPGKPGESRIIELLTARDNSRMPPREAGGPLPRAKIAVLEHWIAEGAKLDPGIEPKADLFRELRARWTPPLPPAAYPFPASITALAFTPDNQKLVVGGQHELTVWDVSTGRLLERLYTRAERAHAMVFLTGRNLAVAGGRPGQEGDVRIYNLHGGKARLLQGVAVRDGVKDRGVLVKQLLEADDSVLCLALSPDGKKLASGGCDRLIYVWSLVPGYPDKPEQTIENHADWVFGLAFSPDGKRLASCSRDKTAKVWDLAARESILTFPDHQSPVYGVAVKPDGKVALSGGEDNQVRFWSMTGEAKQMRVAGGHGKAVFRVLYHPHSPQVITCSADATVRIWNADNAQLIRTLAGHTDWVYALALSPDGNLVASGSWNGEVRVCKLADGSLVRAFNASPGYVPTAAASAGKK